MDETYSEGAMSNEKYAATSKLGAEPAIYPDERVAVEVKISPDERLAQFALSIYCSAVQQHGYRAGDSGPQIAVIRARQLIAALSQGEGQ